MTRSFSYSLVPESFYDETEALNTLEENVRNTIDCFYISADSFNSIFLHTYYDDTMDAVPLDEADRADLLQALQTDYLAGADSDTVWDDSSVILDLLNVSNLQYSSYQLRATLPEDSISSRCRNMMCRRVSRFFSTRTAMRWTRRPSRTPGPA